MQLSKNLMKLPKNKPKLTKRKVSNNIDCDYLLYNSTEDEEQLRLVVKDNYANTVYNMYNLSDY